MEQRIKGQIGQPAACMIENKLLPFCGIVGCEFEVGDYGLKDSAPFTGAVLSVVVALIELRPFDKAVTQSTTTVDNCVGNFK